MASLDTKDREMIDHLHRIGGANVQQLCDLLGVTRNAIRQRIARLEGGGLLKSEQESQSRGRPKNVYRVTPEGLRSLGENYREVAIVCWEAIMGLEDSAVKTQLISEVRDQMAERFRGKLSAVASPGARIDELIVEMRSHGFNVESDSSGALPILRETNCPFPMLADIDETICQVERQVLEQVIGEPVEFKHRCRDGHHCCEFEVQVDGARNN